MMALSFLHSLFGKRSKRKTHQKPHMKHLLCVKRELFSHWVVTGLTLGRSRVGPLTLLYRCSWLNPQGVNTSLPLAEMQPCSRMCCSSSSAANTSGWAPRHSRPQILFHQLFLPWNKAAHFSVSVSELAKSTQTLWSRCSCSFRSIKGFLIRKY